MIDKNKEFILFLSGVSAHDRARIVAALSGEYINTISEIFKNFLGRNLTHDQDDIKRLVKYRREVRQVARKKTPLREKKKILLSRKGGAILSVLLPLAAGLISSFLR